MKNPNTHFLVLENNTDSIKNFLTSLNTIFHFSELLRFEIQKKKKSEMVENIINTNSSIAAELKNYADYSEEICDAVIRISKVFEKMTIQSR